MLAYGLAALAVLTAAAALAAWQAGTLGSASGSLSGVLRAPRSALADSTLLDPPSSGAARGSSLERSLAKAADAAARELAGSRRVSPVSFDSITGLWDRAKPPPHAPPTWRPPTWWQSALALRALVRYLEFTRDGSPVYQRLISDVYRLNVRKPGTNEPARFENNFLDDTAWWGLAWLEAARYERDVRHDPTTAARYLLLAEQDASYIYRHPRRCGSGGIEFRNGFAPNTITNAEFVSLAAQLAQARSAPGPLRDRASAAAWLAKARQILSWLQGSGLVDMKSGTVASTYDDRCRPGGPAMSYIEGETADALTQMGTASHDPVYYAQAAVFLNRVLDPARGRLSGGVIQEPCEAQRTPCAHQLYNITVFKGLLVDAVFDWTRATGLPGYDGFLLAQARATLAHAATNGRSPAGCQSPTDCQLSLYWSRRFPLRRSPIPLTPGTQISGLSALADATVVARTLARGSGLPSAARPQQACPSHPPATPLLPNGCAGPAPTAARPGLGRLPARPGRPHTT